MKLIEGLFLTTLKIDQLYIHALICILHFTERRLDKSVDAEKENTSTTNANNDGHHMSTDPAVPIEGEIECVPGIDFDSTDSSGKLSTVRAFSNSVQHRKSLEAHAQTDAFLSRILSSRNTDQPYLGVRSSLKKFVHGRSRHIEQATGDVAKTDNNEIVIVDESSDRNITDCEIEETNTKQEAMELDYEELTGQDEEVQYDEELSEQTRENTKRRTIELSIAELRDSLNKRSSTGDKKVSSSDESRHFHAKIAPTDNQAAEDELNKILTKDMFSKVSKLLCFIFINCQLYCFICGSLFYTRGNVIDR